MPSPTEELNRLRKALRIADIMQASGISSSMAAMAAEGDTRMAAVAANYAGYTPSAEIWEVVVQLLLDRENATARLQGKRQKDILDVYRKPTGTAVQS